MTCLERPEPDDFEHALAEHPDLDRRLAPLIDDRDVGMLPARDALARRTLAAGVRRARRPRAAADSSRPARAPRDRVFADAFGAGEEQTLGHPAARDRAAEQIDEVRVTDNRRSGIGVDMLVRFRNRRHTFGRLSHARRLPQGSVIQPAYAALAKVRHRDTAYANLETL